MNNKRHESERQRFISNRVHEDWESICNEPRVCGRYQIPARCEECGWNSYQAFNDAEEAADKLMKREKGGQS